MTKSGRTTAVLAGSAFLGALALAFIALTLRGDAALGVRAALRLTARYNFAFFWLAYSGGALTTLFGARFEPLKRNAPGISLAFAAALLVHLALVARLYLIGAPPANPTLLTFGAAAVCVYVLALFSLPQLQRAIGPGPWTFIRFAGVNYVALSFARDFFRDPFHPGIRHALVYLPFAALSVIGPGLRLAAFAKKRMMTPLAAGPASAASVSGANPLP